MSLLSEDREPFRLSPIKTLMPDDTDLFAFGGSVGPNGENRREDVIRAQTLLGRTGDFDPEGVFQVPTGWPSSELYRGIKKFQKRTGLDADGTLLPLPRGGVDQYGVGETIEALRSTLGDSLAGQTAPTPQQVDAHYEAQAKRQATDEDAPTPSSAQNSIVLSDVPDAAPQAKPGEQVAQALPINPAQFAPPPSGGTPDQHRDENGVSPAEKQVGRMLEQRINEKINLLTLPVLVMNHVREHGAATTQAPEDKPTPPSKPVSDADQASTRTPPLMPPKVDTKLQGRPAEKREPTVEQLIPPEMKEWYEGLEPFDQELAKELMLVFNKGGRKGQEATRLGNADTVREILRFLQEERQMGPNVTHTHGSRRNGDENETERPEEYLRGRNSNGTRGASWPDGTIRYANPAAQNTAEEFLRFFSGKTLADGVTGVKSERDQIARAEYNRPGEMMVFVPKLLPDLPDGKVSPEHRKKHEEEIRKTVKTIGLRFEDFLKSKGKL